MKATEHFTKVISGYLEKRAAEDPLFAEKFKNEKKNVELCVTYILNTVQKSGHNGFTDDEIFGMAVHYYDEENINVGSRPSVRDIIINQPVELTPEEIEEAKQRAKVQAIAEVTNEEKMKAKKELKPEIKPAKLTENQKEEAKRLAKERIYEEERARLRGKKGHKKEEPIVEQPTLF